MAAQEEESYHFEMEMELAVTEGEITMEIPITFSGDFQPPDRMQGTVSITMFGSTIEMETITIGETSYAVNPLTGEWEESAEPASPFAPEDFAVVPDEFEDLVLVGEDTLDGTRVYHLRGAVSSGVLGEVLAGTEGEIRVEHWIGVEDGRLRQSVIEGELSMPDDAGSIDLSVTMAYSDYGQDVEIEPPEIPTPAVTRVIEPIPEATLTIIEPAPAATFRPPAPTTTPQVPEAMGELGPGWTTYTTEEGLANNRVDAIVVDEQGALWFATWDAQVFDSNFGVSRFDGQTWTSFTSADGLPPSPVWAIAVDREGTLWFGTIDRGVSSFDGEDWTLFTKEDGLASDHISAIAVDGEGALWFGTSGSGVSRFDGQTWTTYTSDDGLAHDDIEAIAVDGKGALWFGTDGGGVSRFDGETWTTYTRVNGLANNQVTAIAVDAGGTFWFGTSNGVSRFDGESWTTYNTSNGLAGNWVTAIVADRQGVLWFGTDEGVSRFDGETWTTDTAEDGMAIWLVYAIAVDGEGALWFGTQDGVYRYLPEGTSPVPAATSPPDEGQDLLDEVLNAGKLVVSTDPNYAPQSFLNDAGEMEGFDVDVAKEVAARLGVELEFEMPDWDLVISGNWGGRWDVSIGSMIPTERRSEVLWFSDAYYYTPASFAVYEGNDTIETVADLSGKKIGVGMYTTYEDYLHQRLTAMGGIIAYDPPPDVETVAYSMDQEAIQDLALGDGVRLDAVLSALPTILYAIEEEVPIRIVGTPAFYEPLVFALDKSRGPSDRMLAKLNEIVADMHADGTLTELSLKWYGVDLTTIVEPD